MADYVVTADMQRAEAMVASVLSSMDARIGQITGASGTGKTAAGKWLSQRFDGVRVCAIHGLTPGVLLQSVARGFGLTVKFGQIGVAQVIEVLAPVVRDRLIVVDEANHLSWQCLEALRYLPDEHNAALVFTGTPIFTETLSKAQNRVLMAQLVRRIGAKRVVFDALGLEAIGEYVIGPRFGEVNKTIAKKFQTYSGGYWGEAVELADACTRIMAQNQQQKLTETIVDSAGHYLGRRAPHDKKAVA